MNFGKLYEMYENGALNIDMSEDEKSGSIGGMPITEEHAKKLCEIIGWTEYRLSPFKMIEKTKKFMSALNRAGLFREIGADKLGKTDITFINRPDVDYGKTFDRILIKFPKKGYTVVYGMKNAGATYVVFETGGTGTPLSKSKNLKGVAEYLINNI